LLELGFLAEDIVDFEIDFKPIPSELNGFS
jgi:hypothetical protein